MPPKAAPKPVKEIDEAQLIPGAIILFRLRGYPPWPSLIITEEHLPSNVKKAKPKGDVFPVRFFPIEKKPEFAWANPKAGDVQGILTKEEIDAFNENPKKGISKACLAAYKAAAEPVDLDKLKVTEGDEDEEMEDVEAEEEEEDDAALEDVKDLYDEDEEGKGKKRKRAAADDGEDEKPGRKKKSAVVVPTTKKRKSNKENKSETNGSNEPRERKKPGPKPKKPQDDSPKKKSAEEKAKQVFEYRKKEIMYIRHRIQKVLLDKSGKEPEADEFPGIVENLKKLAEFNWINAALIAETKMNKVLKRIVALPAMPQEENFDIKAKAGEILKSWRSHLDELNEMAKKESADTKKGSSSDNEKSPTKSTAKEDTEAKDAEDNGNGEPMEDVEETTTTKPAEDGTKEPETTADDIENADPAEDFVVVEGGGEADALAQEKASEKDKEEAKEEDVSAGAQPPADTESAAAEPAAEPMDTN